MLCQSFDPVHLALRCCTDLNLSSYHVSKNHVMFVPLFLSANIGLTCLQPFELTGLQHHCTGLHVVREHLQIKFAGHGHCESEEENYRKVSEFSELYPLNNRGRMVRGIMTIISFTVCVSLYRSSQRL